MKSTSMMQWFDPSVAKEDFFVRPNFALGQFFFSAQTARALVQRFDRYRNPCCMCTPRLAHEWASRGRTVRLLDCDVRFATLPGFRRFDLLRPERIDEDFDLVIVDPIFVPAEQLRRAVELVMPPVVRGSTADLFITFPVERESELLAAFTGYGLMKTDVNLKHNNVKASADGAFGLYGTGMIA